MLEFPARPRSRPLFDWFITLSVCSALPCLRNALDWTATRFNRWYRNTCSSQIFYFLRVVYTVIVSALKHYVTVGQPEVVIYT